MRRVIVVGGGAAGMMAAVAAAENGAQVDLYEKNEKTGKKVYITGKGRCNVTNACSPEEFLSHVCRNPKFLYSCFNRFTNEDMQRFLEAQGCRLKTERGNRVFPVSDHASDVIAALNQAMERAGVRVHLNTQVSAVGLSSTFDDRQKEKRKVSYVRLSDGATVDGDSIVICTGGLSYRSTGSTGDGLRFASDMGLSVTPCHPSLVPMTTQEEDIPTLQGLSLKNVTLTIKEGKKKHFEEFGEMMFTHFGITGPLVLTASTVVGDVLAKGKTLTAQVDLKPALTDQQLDARLLREFQAGINKQLDHVMGALLPAKMVSVVIARSGLSSTIRVHDISRAQRLALLETMRHFSMTVTGLRDYNEAIITRGGVAVKELRPDTMEAKKIAGLYVAGEVVDVDAVTGGFNLQIAWSTGYAAGCAAAREDG